MYIYHLSLGRHMVNNACSDVSAGQISVPIFMVMNDVEFVV